jgi:multidrug resistance efflux pump
MIRLTGTTEALQMRSIVAPILQGQHLGMLTITKLVAAGTKVRQGDIVAEFDRQAQTREFIDKQALYQDLANKVIEEQAKEGTARAADETEIGQAENDLRKAQLEAQKIELLSRIDAEKNQNALEAAKATLQQLRTTFDLKRQSAQAGIRLIELQRDRARQVMEHAQKNAELMQVRAPISGVVVLNTIWKQGKLGEVQEGDQVRPGTTFMQVVDPSQMQVRAFANQEDFLNMQLGQHAKVYLDAYPELVFAGKLEEISPAATSGDFSSKLRKFAIVFAITGNDPKLMPDLSAAVDVNITAQAGLQGAFQ